MRRLVLISECVSAPFDEGLKNVLHQIIIAKSKKENAIVVTRADNNTDGLTVKKIKLNKIFINNRLRLLLKNNSPQIILYVPEASCTFNSFVRAKMLKLMSRLSVVVMLAVQHREFTSIQSRIITKLLRPDLLLLLGKSDEYSFVQMGLKVRVLPPAVDNMKFSPVSRVEKERIRAEYNIPTHKKIVLHVGHIRTSRNLECFCRVQKINNVQVVIVGSTSTPQDRHLKENLMNAGILVIDEFIPDISKLYKMSDIYVFPVVNNMAAIGMPLSVLEALACNLPVVSTNFGGLIEHFEEDNGFRYFNKEEELVQLIKKIDVINVHNRKKIESLTWANFTDKIISACEELL